MITLHQFGNSVCCQKVRIVLCEKGLDWDSVEVDLFRSEQYHPDYLKLNPKGVVPTLVHDGKALIESTLICEYLDDVFPEPPLVPADPWLRSRMRQWTKAVDEGLHEGVTEISFSAMFRERMKTMSDEQRETRFANIGDPRRRDRFKSTYQMGVRSPFVLHAIAAYEKAFGRLEESLADTAPWILGADPTLADIALMPYVARLDNLGLLDVWIENRPRVRDWWARARQWPSFKTGLADPLTADQLRDMHAHGRKIRDDVAELRAGLQGGGAGSRV